MIFSLLRFPEPPFKYTQPTDTETPQNWKGARRGSHERTQEKERGGSTRKRMSRQFKKMTWTYSDIFFLVHRCPTHKRAFFIDPFTQKRATCNFRKKSGKRRQSRTFGGGEKGKVSRGSQTKKKSEQLRVPDLLPSPHPALPFFVLYFFVSPLFLFYFLYLFSVGCLFRTHISIIPCPYLLSKKPIFSCRWFDSWVSAIL